jgi:hypothetical protein
MSLWEEIQQDPAALRTYLDSVDERLASAGIAIHAREIHAWREVQKDMRICVSFGDPSLKPIGDYFNRKYAGRALWDPCIGRILVILGHEAWGLRFSLVYGNPRPITLREMIQDCPPDLEARLSDEEKSMLDRLLPRAQKALEAMRDVPIDVRADWPAAVDQAIDPRGNFGLSKWCSQQVVEKMLKAYLRKQGDHKLHHTHDVGVLASKAEERDLRTLDRALLNSVECRPALRYPGNGVTLAEAVAANQASVLLCGHIAMQW